MWRMKVTAVSLIVMGALLFGSVVAYAGWGWNAKVNVEGKMVSMSWSVDGVKGKTDNNAVITLDVPESADVTVVKIAHRREVFNLVRTGDYECSAAGIGMWSPPRPLGS